MLGKKVLSPTFLFYTRLTSFVGDASATRFDAYFGDNHSFQPTLYQKMKDVAAKYGGESLCLGFLTCV